MFKQLHCAFLQIKTGNEDFKEFGLTLTFVPQRDCRKRAWIWYCKLLFGQLARGAENKSINEEIKSILAAGQQNTRESAEELLWGNLYLHLHLGTNRQAVPAALVDGSITVWKEKQQNAQWTLWAWWGWRWWVLRVCVERWGLEILTGFHSRPGNSTSPLMKARLEQRHVMQSRGNTARGRRRKKKKDEEWHTHKHCIAWEHFNYKNIPKSGKGHHLRLLK